jgi:hypothetical protein
MCCVWTKKLKRNNLMVGALYPNFQGSQGGSGLPETKIVREPKRPNREGEQEAEQKKREEETI